MAKSSFVLMVMAMTLSHFGIEAVTITSIKVPPAVEHGSETPVVLDCEYSLAAHEKQGLVVQWFLRDHPVPVYQWIPGKRPQDNGPLKGRLNLEYRATEDPYHRHRALEILRPSTDLSGEYRCKVATFDNEDTASSSMVVYVPANAFTVHSTKTKISTVNVTCLVEGVYPEPHLELIQQDGPHGARSSVSDAAVSVTARPNGRFDAILQHVFEDRLLPSSETVFECLLSLPGTEYQVSQKTTYLPGPPTSALPPPPENDIDDQADSSQSDEVTWTEDHMQMSSSSTSIPASSAHRSRDDDNEAVNDDDQWPTITGRGIRAHESQSQSAAAVNGASLNSPLMALLLLVVTIVAASA